MAAQDDLKENAATLCYETLSKAPDMVLWVEAGGRIQFANAAACQRLGFSHAELVSRTLNDLAPGCIHSGDPNPGTTYETYLLCRKGTLLPVEINTAAVAHLGKDFICLFARDISECRRSEAEFRQNEERLRAIGQALPDLVFVIDEEGRHLEVLTAQESLLFTPIENITNRLLHDIFEAPLAECFLALIQKTINTRETGVIEYELPVKDGSRWFEARTAAMDQQIDGRNCVVWIARDITDQKRAEDLARQKVYLEEQLLSELNYGEIVGASAQMKTVFKHINMVAPLETTILIMGETGTGKELIARAIHHASPRKDHVLIKVNCGALPADLVESELFGHEKGAFTGAASQKRGRFELAQNGTIFFDEIGELPLAAQTKLLRVLEEREFERVGGEQTLIADVRVIAATNRKLEKEVQEGRFRADLYYRLNIFPITVPPLRERKGDIPLLAAYFIKKFADRMGKAIGGMHPVARERLLSASWAGNVRELANVLERAVILCQGPVLDVNHLGILKAGPAAAGQFLSLQEMERRHILEALSRTGGVLSGAKGAAALLHMNRSTLWSRMQKLGIRMVKSAS